MRALNPEANPKANQGAPRPHGRTVRGQGLTEYIVILALIAIAAVVSVSFFGTAVKSQFVALSAELVGGEGGSVIGEVESQVADQGTAANTAATLKTYTEN